MFVFCFVRIGHASPETGRPDGAGIERAADAHAPSSLTAQRLVVRSGLRVRRRPPADELLLGIDARPPESDVALAALPQQPSTHARHAVVRTRSLRVPAAAPELGGRLRHGPLHDGRPTRQERNGPADARAAGGDGRERSRAEHSAMRQWIGKQRDGRIVGGARADVRLERGGHYLRLIRLRMLTLSRRGRDRVTQRGVTMRSRYRRSHLFPDNAVSSRLLRLDNFSRPAVTRNPLGGVRSRFLFFFQLRVHSTAAKDRWDRRKL